VVWVAAAVLFILSSLSSPFFYVSFSLSLFPNISKIVAVAYRIEEEEEEENKKKSFKSYKFSCCVYI